MEEVTGPCWVFSRGVGGSHAGLVEVKVGSRWPLEPWAVKERWGQEGLDGKQAQGCWEEGRGGVGLLGLREGVDGVGHCLGQYPKASSPTCWFGGSQDP